MLLLYRLLLLVKLLLILIMINISDYQDFLNMRCVLMVQYIREYYESLK